MGFCICERGFLCLPAEVAAISKWRNDPVRFPNFPVQWYRQARQHSQQSQHYKQYRDDRRAELKALKHTTVYYRLPVAVLPRLFLVVCEIVILSTRTPVREYFLQYFSALSRESIVSVEVERRHRRRLQTCSTCREFRASYLAACGLPRSRRGEGDSQRVFDVVGNVEFEGGPTIDLRQVQGDFRNRRSVED